MRQHENIIWFCKNRDNKGVYHGAHFVSYNAASSFFFCTVCYSAGLSSRCNDDSGCKDCNECPHCQNTDTSVDPATIKPDEGARYPDTFSVTDMENFFKPKEQDQ